MEIAVTWNDVRNKISQSAALSMHALFSGGVGFLAGRTINMCDRWLHPVKNALGKPPIVNPLHGAICGITFALVDRVAYVVLKKYLPNQADNPIAHAARVIVSITLATIATSAVLPISISMAAVLLTTNVLATTLLVSIATYYTKLVYQRKAAPAQEKKPQEVPDHSSDRKLASVPVKKPEALKEKLQPILVRA